ncbi:MAG: ABC transporter ATP-binding protein, partial [Altererythrobacter sp.]|nr:ABC transporter ATP-binding protein [Altererythrobacter sp.]
NMAVIVGGEIKLEGSPKELIEKARGTVWAKTIERAELESHRRKYEVISTRLFAGRTIVHVLSDTDPENGFVNIDGGLEDVYFSTLAHSRRPAAAATAAA